MLEEDDNYSFSWEDIEILDKKPINKKPISVLKIKSKAKNKIFIKNFLLFSVLFLQNVFLFFHYVLFRYCYCIFYFLMLIILN